MSLTHSRGGGSGREAVPALSDGMRAPPATEADVVVELETVMVEAIVKADGVVKESEIPTEADIDEESEIPVEAEVVGEIDVDVFAALPSPSGFTGQSFRLLLLGLCWSSLLTRPSEPAGPLKFRQRSAPAAAC